jgi:ActR/RegA family two-component response regulator
MAAASNEFFLRGGIRLASERRGPTRHFSGQNVDTPDLARAKDECLLFADLARAEWEHIHRVLSDCAGNVSEAARRLGIHRRSLQRKLQKLAPE